MDAEIAILKQIARVGLVGRIHTRKIAVSSVSVGRKPGREGAAKVCITFGGINVAEKVGREWVWCHLQQHRSAAPKVIVYEANIAHADFCALR